MILKVTLCHIVVIWGLAQGMAQLNRGKIPAGVRSSMIANGWRPLTNYEGKNNGHSASINGGGSLNERHSGPHPVHGKLQEHMSNSEKLTAKHKQSHDYNPPSILGSFSVFGHSMAKVRGNSEPSKPQVNQVGSETREFSFLVPPPRDPVRYEIDPYRKVILRDNDVFLRQPTQYIISNGPADLRSPQYYTKGGAAVAASTHTITTSQNRPVISDYSGVSVQQSPRPHQQQQQQQQQQQNIPFESLKLSTTKLYLQPPSANGPLDFASEQQQPTNNLYDRYLPSSLAHNQQLSQENPAGNFYSHINHPSPSYNGQNLERDPSFLVHESHEVSYPTAVPLAQPGFAAFGNFRPSSPYETIHQPERYSTQRPTVSPTEKFVPSKTDDTRQKQEAYGRYGQNSGNSHLDNSIVSSAEPTFPNGIVNTYYISEQQSLTPPAPTWSTTSKAKLTADINEVLPKANRPAMFKTETANTGGVEHNHQVNVPNVLITPPEIPQQQLQQQYYPHNSLPLISQQPELIYETPASISLKHFNEQQYRLQQQLLQRDRERLREQELQRQQQQDKLERLEVTKNREKASTTISRPIPETPESTVRYIDTTVGYTDLNNHEQIQDLQRYPGQQFVQQEYHENYYSPQSPNVQVPVIKEAENASVIPDANYNVTSQSDKTSIYGFSETPATTGYRTRPRKPISGNAHDQHRRKKPTTPLYEEQTYHQEEQHHLSTLAPNPTVLSSETLNPETSSTDAPTVTFRGTNFASLTPVTRGSTTTIATKPTTITKLTTKPKQTTTTMSTSTMSTTTSKPRTRRPSSSNVSSGRRRRPTTTTTTQEPETTPQVTYQQEDYTKYEKFETDLVRRKKIKPSLADFQSHYVHEPVTSTEKKRFEIKNYGHKLETNEQDYITESPETYSPGIEQASVQQSYGYGNEHSAQFYTPAFHNQVTTGQEFTDYETSGYPTVPTASSNQASSSTQQENINDAEVTKSVYTNLRPEEYSVNTVSVTTPTPTTTTVATPTTAGPTVAGPTRSSYIRTTGIPSTTIETIHTTRTSPHRMRPMRFGNTTRPRFSVKDYKSRLDYRSRMSTNVTNVTGRHKNGSSKIPLQIEDEPVESTTARYRHMTRASYRISSTTPSYHSRRGDSGNSSTERTNKFAPKRRFNNNHLYKSKTSTSTVTPQSSVDDGDVITLPSAKQTPVRTENIFSSAIRRRPQMKHATFTQSSNTRTTKKDSTEMIPEETSFYSPAISQLLVTDPSSMKDKLQTDRYVGSSDEDQQNDGIASTSRPTEVPSTMSVSLDRNLEDPQSFGIEDSNASQYSRTTTDNPVYETGQTEALVKESEPTVDSQLEEDLFAKASQSVADLTSSASALYDKPGMFKAVSVAPEVASITNSRFRIIQDKPTLPIEAFFQEFSKTIESR